MAPLTRARRCLAPAFDQRIHRHPFVRQEPTKTHNVMASPFRKLTQAYAAAGNHLTDDLGQSPVEALVSEPAQRLIC